MQKHYSQEPLCQFCGDELPKGTPQAITIQNESGVNQHYTRVCERCWDHVEEIDENTKTVKEQEGQ